MTFSFGTKFLPLWDHLSRWLTNGLYAVASGLGVLVGATPGKLKDVRYLSHGGQSIEDGSQ